MEVTGHGLKVGDKVTITSPSALAEYFTDKPWVVSAVAVDRVWVRRPEGGPEYGVRLDFVKRKP